MLLQLSGGWSRLLECVILGREVNNKDIFVNIGYFCPHLCLDTFWFTSLTQKKKTMKKKKNEKDRPMRKILLRGA